MARQESIRFSSVECNDALHKIYDFLTQNLRFDDLDLRAKA